MKSRLLLFALVCFSITSAFSQFTSIGLIGSATPGGWDRDTFMVQDAADSAVWTLRVTLIEGEAKFRADTAWDVNWGSADFPVGIGTQGGDNILVDSAEYHIKINTTTGAYSFIKVQEFITVGLIGSAGPFSWDADTNMVQDSANRYLFSLDIDLLDGKAKFRADDKWDVNWGSSEFPKGIGVQGGMDIPVFGGNYHVTFDAAHGEYDFQVNSPIGIIGDATTKGWDADTDMFQDQTDSNKFFTTIELTAGAVKFRQDNAWDISWGADEFPSGIAENPGVNIPIMQAGTYLVNFDTATGEYSFEQLLDISNVGVIGGATVGGWDSVTFLIQDVGDPDIWSGSVTLTDGGLQFSANEGMLVWGDTLFPKGVAVLGGDTIPAMTGDWLVTFNSFSGEFDFLPLEIFATVGILGDATPGGWDTDTDMERDPLDSAMWSLRLELTDGEAKFRSDDDWAISWGAGFFPTGVATRGGANIPITAGDYVVTFNSNTGDYNFREIIEFDAISLVGKSGPFGAWPPEDDASNDFFLDQDPNNPQAWSATNVTLTDHMGADDEGVKFRADTAWMVNWGAADFPAGIGTQDGSNIVTIAGTYNISFNAATGEYVFVDPSTVSTKDLIDPSAIVTFPNPVRDLLHINIEGVELSGQVTLSVVDMSGKRLMSVRTTASKYMELDVSNLQVGNYLLQLSNSKLHVGKKFIVSK